MKYDDLEKYLGGMGYTSRQVRAMMAAARAGNPQRLPFGVLYARSDRRYEIIAE